MRAAVLLGVLLLEGCGSSPPTRFYLLDAVSPQQPVAARVDEPLKVDAVHIPPALDRTQMVRGESHNELQISSQERWAADFGEMARRVLTQDLQARLPMGAVIAPESPAPANAHGVVVDILSFEPDASGQLMLAADWSLLQGTPATPIARHSVRLTLSVIPSASAQAAGMSQLLGRLADDIAARVAPPPSAATH